MVMVNVVIGMEVEVVVCWRCEVVFEILNVGKGKFFISKMLCYILKGDVVFILMWDFYVFKNKKIEF